MNEDQMTAAEYEELKKIAGLPAMTNKSANKIAMECEQEILKAGKKAVNLALIPQDQHHLYNEWNVTVPQEILDFLSDCEYPLSKDIVTMIEKKMDLVHNIVPTAMIEMGLYMQFEGKPYEFLKELQDNDIRTGFTYQHTPLE